MYKHIAVGLDGSAAAAAAEDLALVLARRLGATVHGIHVVNAAFLDGAYITDISGAMGFEPFVNLQAQVRATLTEVGEAIRSRFLDRCGETGVPHQFHLQHAGVVSGLLNASRTTDLLLVGREGLTTRFREDVLGPTTESLLRRSTQPVLVVPDRCDGISRPLAAFDGSPKALRALHHAGRLAVGLGTTLTVVTVDPGEERRRARLAEAAEYLAPFGVSVECRGVAGEEPEEALLDLLGEDGFDLLVLGAHGHTRVVEMVLGSTTAYLVRRSPAPVLCVTRA